MKWMLDTRTRHDSRRRRRHSRSSRGMKWMLELGMGNRDPTNAACPLPVLGHTSMSSLLICSVIVIVFLVFLVVLITDLIMLLFGYFNFLLLFVIGILLPTCSTS